MGIREEVKKRVIQKRSGLGGRDILAIRGVKDQDLFHYHWINDIGDRLQERYKEGYEFVDASGVIIEDVTVESARGTDRLAKKQVGRGTFAYLMKIPMEIYEEYQTEKRLRNDAVNDEIKGSGKQKGFYGDVKVST